MRPPRNVNTHFLDLLILIQTGFFDTNITSNAKHTKELILGVFFDYILHIFCGYVVFFSCFVCLLGVLNLLQFYEITTTKTSVKILDDDCEDVDTATCTTNGERASFFDIDCGNCHGRACLVGANNVA